MSQEERSELTGQEGTPRRRRLRKKEKRKNQAPTKERSTFKRIEIIKEIRPVAETQPTIVTPLLNHNETEEERSERIRRMQACYESGLLKKLEQMMSEVYLTLETEYVSRQTPINEQFVIDLGQRVETAYFNEYSDLGNPRGEIQQAITDMNKTAYILLQHTYSIRQQASWPMRFVSVIYSLLTTGILSFVLFYLAKDSSEILVSSITCLEGKQPIHPSNTTIPCFNGATMDYYPPDQTSSLTMTIVTSLFTCISTVPFSFHGNIMGFISLLGFLSPRSLLTTSEKLFTFLKEGALILLLGGPAALASITPTHDAVKTFIPKAADWLKHVLAPVNLLAGSVPNAMVYKNRGLDLKNQYMLFWNAHKNAVNTASTSYQSLESQPQLSKKGLLEKFRTKLFELEKIHAFGVNLSQAEELRKKLTHPKHTGLAVLAGLLEPTNNVSYTSVDKRCLFYFTVGMGLSLSLSFLGNYSNLFLIRDMVVKQLKAWDCPNELADIIGMISGIWGCLSGTGMQSILLQTGVTQKIFRNSKVGINLGWQDLVKLIAPIFTSICNFAVAMITKGETGAMFWPSLACSIFIAIVMGYEGATDTITELFPSSSLGRTAAERNELLIKNLIKQANKLEEPELQCLLVLLETMAHVPAAPVAPAAIEIEEPEEPLAQTHNAIQ